MAFLALKKWGSGYFGTNINVGQRLEVYARNSFTVVNFHDLWSNYPRSIWHVIGLVYEKWGGGNLGQAQILGAMASHALAWRTKCDETRVRQYVTWCDERWQRCAANTGKRKDLLLANGL